MDEDEVPEEEAEAGLEGRDRALLAFVRQQTRVLAKLAQARDPQNEDLAPLLGGPSEISSHSVGGARGTAALEAQRRHFEQRPDAAIQETRRLLARANGTDPSQRQDA
eukprot:9173558-Lingulodinium_polyedra.AAC.1